jgi:hypothetical protein
MYSFTGGAKLQGESGHIRSVTSEWLETVFPFHLDFDEEISVQPFWANNYPNPRPEFYDLRTLFFRSLSGIERFLVDEGTTKNLAVAFSVFKRIDRRIARTIAHFSRSATIGIDLDCGPDKPHADFASAVNRVSDVAERFDVPPIALVASGEGLQAYFGLREPVSDAALFASVLGRLSHELDGDESARDITRALRPPGTLTFKYAPPREVNMLHRGTERIDIRELNRSLPQRSPTAATSVPAPRRSPRQAATPGSRGFQELLEGVMPSRFNGDTSRRDFYVACCLAERGMGLDVLIQTLTESEVGAQARQRKANPVDYLRRTAEKALSKVSGGHGEEGGSK